MNDMQAIASIIETLGMIGLMLLWLRDKNDQLEKERNNRDVLSRHIIEDWQNMARDRSEK